MGGQECTAGGSLGAPRGTSSPALDRLAGALRAALGPGTVQAGQPLARYTALRIGGPADLLVVADSVDALRKAVLLAVEHKLAWRILGGGCNVLVSDAGVRGLVIVNRARAIAFSTMGADGGTGRGPGVQAESGASFSTVAQQCVARGLAGLEWATGIPGTVGGAVVGNAGAWGSDVAANLIEADIMEPEGTVVTWPVARFRYGYRSSALKQQASLQGDQALADGSSHQAVVLVARFALQEGDLEMLKARVADITTRRKASQPGGASCGSVFKNPPGDSAGRLIEAAGLKGRQSGGAEISAKHANFVLNRGQATAADVKALIDLAHDTVWTRFGVALELEIQLVGGW